MDDGSTDSSYETAKKFSDTDKRFKVFRTENGGVSKARNYALEKACGKYATFVDSDDELYKTALETLYRAAEENDADHFGRHSHRRKKVGCRNGRKRQSRNGVG